MGVGQWNPRIITQATGELGQGLEKLGGGVEDLNASLIDKSNQLQQAQARAAVISQTTGALAKLPGITDPGQLDDLKSSITDTVSEQASQFKDPRQGALFTADITPHVAETFAHFDGRTREINNNNAVAGYETFANTTINNAAAIDDDNMSSAGLRGINSHVQTLQDTGVITPEQAVAYRKQASVDYVEARYAYLEQWAITHQDPSRLQRFITSQQPIFSPADETAPTGPVNQTIPPEGRALLATIYGPESGARYDERYSPSGRATFSSFADHPRVKEVIPPGQPNARLTSDAAGAGQMLSSTWDMEKAKLGLADFSPANQDLANWDLAKTTYQQKTGRDLLSDLQSRDPRVLGGVAVALKGKWSSLPGGVQPGTTTDRFTNTFFTNLDKQTQAGPAFRGLSSAPASAAQPGQVAAAGDSLAVGVAGALGQTDQRFAKESIPPVGKPGEDTVQARLDALAPTDVRGKTVILSSGASNAPGLDPATYLPGQIKSLKDKGAANVVVLGTGTRADLAPLNAKLQAEAQKAGATFQPLDAGMLSPDGVHPIPAGYKAIAQQVGRAAAPAPSFAPGQVAGPGAPPLPTTATAALSATSLPTDPPPTSWPPGTAYIAHSKAGDVIFVGHDGRPLPPQLQPSLASARAADDLSGAAPTAVPTPAAPPQSQWPPGTVRVAPNPDGTLSYVSGDGSATPVPGSKATGAPGAWLPNRPSGSLLDALPAQEHAQLLMRAQMALDRISRQSDLQQQQASKQAIVEMDGIAKAMAAGMTVDDIPWDGYRKSFAAAIDPNVRLEFAQVDAIRNQLVSFKGMSPDGVAARVDAARADYGKAFAANPANADTYIKGEVMDASEQYLKQLQADIAKNALGRASRDGVITGVAPLSNAQSIQSRVAQAQRVQDFYHLDTPQYLMPQERAELKKVAAVGGQPMIDMATAIVAGGGAAAPAIFKEIGGSAPGLQAIGKLALDPNGDHSDTISSIAGYAHALADPDARKDLPRFNEGFLRSNKIDDPLGEAYFGFGPDEEARLRSTANMIMGARANDAGVDPKLDKSASPLTDQSWYDKAYDDALGANYDKDGNKYGGVANVGGHWGSWSGWGGSAHKTIAPSDVRADKLDRLFDSIKDSDLTRLPSQPYSGSSPMTMSQLRDGQIIAVPGRDGLFTGGYAIRIPDPNGGPARDVVDQYGKRFVLDLNDQTLNAALRQRVRDAFLTGAPSRAAPMTAPAKPYRNLPGMLEATAANETGTPTIPQGD